MDIGDAVHIQDLQMPEGVAAIYETDLALVTVVPPSVEEAPTPAAPVTEEVAAEPVAPEEQKEAAKEES